MPCHNYTICRRGIRDEQRQVELLRQRKRQAREFHAGLPAGFMSFQLQRLHAHLFQQFALDFIQFVGQIHINLLGVHQTAGLRP